MREGNITGDKIKQKNIGGETVPTMNETQFAFIIAVNDEQYYEECCYYIRQLEIPVGFTIDILAVREADSMCAAYNAAMKNSAAKYRIYLHQDVFVREKDFLKKLLTIFMEDADVGIVGVIGGNHMPKTGVTYRAWDVGIVECKDPDMAYYLAGASKYVQDTYVEAIDGLLIATQYDIPWREDLLNHFDFYDISQSFEMRKRGYKILVPYQEMPWVIHDSSFAKMKHYDEGRRTCLAEYPEFLYAAGGFEFEAHEEWDKLSAELAARIKRLMEQGEWEETATVIKQYRSGKMKDSTLERLGIMSDIEQDERKAGIHNTFFGGIGTYQQMHEKYVHTRFLFFRMEQGLPESEYEELTKAIADGSISCEAVMCFVLHAVADRKGVLVKLKNVYRKTGRGQEEKCICRLYDAVKDKPVPVAYTGVPTANCDDVGEFNIEK